MQNTTTNVESLLVTRTPTVGDVLTCVTAAGRCEWAVPTGGGGGGGGGENGAYATDSAGVPLTSNATVIGTGPYVVVAGENSGAGGATGNRSVCLGVDSAASGTRATVAGIRCTATGSQSVAGGEDSTATGDRAVALGYHVSTGGDGDVCVGNAIDMTLLSTNPQDNVAVGNDIKPISPSASAGGHRNIYVGAYVHPHNATASNAESDNIYIGRDVNAIAGGGQLGTSENINIGLFNVTNEVGTALNSNIAGVLVGSYQTTNQGEDGHATTMVGTENTVQFTLANGASVSPAVVAGYGNALHFGSVAGRFGAPFATVSIGSQNQTVLGTVSVGVNNQNMTDSDGGMFIGRDFRWNVTPTTTNQVILIGRGITGTPITAVAGIMIGDALQPATAVGGILSSYNDQIILDQSSPNNPFTRVYEGSGMIDNGLPSSVITADTTLAPAQISPGSIVLLGGSKTLISPGDSASPAYLTLTLPSQAAMQSYYTLTQGTAIDPVAAERVWIFYVRNTSSTYAYIPATDQFDVGVWQLALGTGWAQRPATGTSLCIMPESTVEFTVGKSNSTNSFYIQRNTPLSNPFVCNSATDVDGTVNDSAGTTCTVTTAGTAAAVVAGVVGGGTVSTGVARVTATAQYVQTAVPGKTPFIVGLATTTVFGAFRMTFTVASPIYLPLTNLTPGAYNFNVDWGDASSQLVTTSGTVVHNYGAAGTYSVVCIGTVDGITLDFPAESLTAFLADITEWGPGKLIGTAWLRGQSSLATISAADAPDLSLVTDGANAFQDCTALTTAPNFSVWPLLPGTDRTEMFRGCNQFNGAVYPNLLTGATSISGVFQDCALFDNGSVSMAPIALGAGCDYSSAFEGASTFNQFPPTAAAPGPDMSRVFAFASSFNRNLGTGFVTSAVTTMEAMFAGAGAFDNGGSDDMGTWDVTSVTTINDMFQFAASFSRRIFGSGAGFWDPGAMTACVGSFLGCSAFNNGGFSMQGSVLPVGADLSSMFNGCTALTVLPPSCLGVANATGTFAGCSLFNAAGLGGIWTTSGCTSFQSTFTNCVVFDQDLGTGFVDAACTTLQSMFDGAAAYNNGGNDFLLSWDVSGVTTMERCFAGDLAINHEILHSTGWNFAALTSLANCSSMFDGASGFANGGLPVQIDFSAGGARTVDCTRMLADCVSLLQSVTLLLSTTVGSSFTCTDMFVGCTLFDSDLSATDVQYLQVPGFNSFQGTAWSQANFDLAMEAWGFTQSATTPSGAYVIDVTGLGLTEPAGGTALTGFTTLTVTKGWTIIGLADALTMDFSLPTSNDVLEFVFDAAGTYDYMVDWGDGSPLQHVTTNSVTHNYTNVGAETKVVKLDGQVWGLSFQNIGTSTAQLTAINRWSAGVKLIGAGGWFSNRAQLAAVNATDAPDVSSVTAMNDTFSACTTLATFNQTGLDAWVIPSGLQYIRAFSRCPLTGVTFGPNWFNNPSWCSDMFGNAYDPAPGFNASFSPSISIPAGTIIGSLFSFCFDFNQTPPELAPGRGDMGSVFPYASSFTGPLPASWLTAATTCYSFYRLFQNASVFDQDLGSTFVTSSASNLAIMFEGATAFTNGGSNSIESWDTSNVGDFMRMLGYGSINYNLFGAGKWSLVVASDTSEMLRNTTTFNNGGVAMELNFGTTDRVINMTGMFRGCTALTDTAAFGGTPTYPSGAGTFIYMNETYNGCTSLTGATAPANFINNRVVSLLGTFLDCTSFVGSVAMCSWDTSNVGEFCGSGGVAVGSRGTFQNTLFNQSVVQAAAPHWDFTSATRTSKMFPPAFTNGGQQVVFKPLTNTGTLDCREMFSVTGCNDFDIDFDTTGVVGTIQADDFFPSAGWDNSLAGCHIKRIIAPGFRHYSTSWSQANFNATIEAWGVTFSGDAPAGWIVDVTGSPITFAGTTGAALTGYTYLTGTQGWTFIGTGF